MSLVNKIESLIILFCPEKMQLPETKFGGKKRKKKNFEHLVIVKYTFELKRDLFNGCFSIKRTLNLANPNIIFRTHWILIFYMKNDLNGVHA
jgi:hypothetical protein